MTQTSRFFAVIDGKWSLQIMLRLDTYCFHRNMIIYRFFLALVLNMALFRLSIGSKMSFGLKIQNSSQVGYASIECLGRCESVHSYCRKLENLTMLDVYPREDEQCSGSPGFVGADVAPASFCRLGYDRFESH